MNYGYTKEKLGATIQSLATDGGDVRKRLARSFQLFHSLNEEDFPDVLRNDWKWILNQLTKFGPVYDGKGEVVKGDVDNTMKKIKNSTGEKIAERIFKLYLRINDY